MIFKIFSVYDDAAAAYLQPFFTPTVGLAMRSMSDMLVDPKHPFTMHASQFTLFHLGEFDDATGAITMLPTPAAIGKCSEFIARKEG